MEDDLGNEEAPGIAGSWR